MKCNPKPRFFVKRYSVFLLSIIVLLSLQCNQPQTTKQFISLTGDWYLSKDSTLPDTSLKQDKTSLKKVFLPTQSMVSINVWWPQQLFTKQDAHDSPTKRGSYQKVKKLTSPVWVWRTFFLEEIPHQVLGVYLGKIGSIDETYINNFLIGKSGGLLPRMDEPLDKIRAYSIPSHFLIKGRNTIVIKITTPSHNISTGLYAKEIFITEHKIITKQLFKEYIFASTLSLLALMTGIYFLLFARGILDLEAIKYFGLGCVFLAIYIIFYGNLKYFFSDHSIALKKAEYSSLMVFPILFLGYIFALCGVPKNIPFKITLGVASLLFVIFLTPGVKNTVMFATLRFGQVYIVVGMLLGLVTYGQHSFLFTRKENIYILIGYASLLATGLNDILVSIGLLPTPRVFKIGVFGYLFANSIFLKFKLSEFESLKENQVSQLSELAGYTFSEKSFQDFTKSCYDLIRKILKYQFVGIEIISDTRNESLEFSHDFLKNKINLIQYEEVTLRNIHIIKQEIHRNQIFFIPLYSLANKKEWRGRLLIALKKDVVREQHLQLFRTLQATICAGISHLDHNLQMKNLNKNLNEKVERRTAEVNQQFSHLQKMKSKQTTFFAGLTHDIKTPLSLITMPVENLLKKQNVFSEKDQNSLHKVKYNIYRMIRMINSVLDMAKFELKEVRTELTLGDMAKFIQRLSNLYSEILRAYNLTLVTDIESKEILVFFDAEKIEKIMDNLMNNAVKYSQPKGEIHISLHQLDHQNCSIRVKNQGQGLSIAEKENLFRPFSQIHDAQGIYNLGSGLGLNISQQYVEQHGGTIYVESKKGEYTEFILHLPLHLENKGEVSDESLNKELYLTLQNREMAFAYEGLMQQKAQNTENKTFCLLFDEKKHWKILISSLEEEFVLDFFSDTTELLKKTDVSGISMIIMVNQIRETHIETIKKIKASKSHRYLPILFLARSDPDGLSSQCILEGVEECLREPIHALEVLLKNQRFVNEYHLRHEVSKKDLLEKKIDKMNDLIIKEAKIHLLDEPYKKDISGKNRFLKSMTCRDQSIFYIVGESTSGQPFDRIERYCMNMLISLNMGRSGEEILPNQTLEKVQKIFPFVGKEKLLLCSGVLSPDKKIFQYANASLPEISLGEEEFNNIKLKKTGPPLQKNQNKKWKNQTLTFS